MYEARAHGADAVLLIVAMLDPGLLGELHSLTQELWMQSLVECMTRPSSSRPLKSTPRSLGSTTVTFGPSRPTWRSRSALRPAVPAGKIVVSESGVSSRENIDRVGAAGAHAVLVGEALVTSADPGARLRGLV